MISAAIDAGALAKMLYTSLLACIGVAVIFSFALFGAIRAFDMRRSHRSVAAAAYGTLATTGVIVIVAVVVYGLALVAHKS
jgi:hypothetical protein